jgi:predicted ABC-type ATPase
MILDQLGYIRNGLDYSFHKTYSKERQSVQNDIILKEIDQKKSSAKKNILLTAGAMGAGKTHTIKRLLGQCYYDYVVADVDKIKYFLPEMKQLLKTDPKNAGLILHSEACTIHELMFKIAINNGLNVIIDGSLRNGEFFLPLVKEWKLNTPYEIIIVHVIATLATCIRRAKKRERITGRIIPEKSIRKSLAESPISVQMLTPYVDHVITIHNDIDDV